MKKFTVTYEQEVRQQLYITIEAENEKDARNKIMDGDYLDKEAHLCDESTESFNILSVDEDG